MTMRNITMKNDNHLLYLMQFAGGTFPSGGFSQSWGLETYVSQGKVKDEETFMEFAEVYMETTVSACEGPLVAESHRLAQCRDIEKIKELEELSRAVKVTREGRESSIRMGKAFMRITSDIIDDECLSEIRNLYGSGSISYPVIYGLVCGRLGLDVKESVEAFVFSTMNALVQSAVKLIPLGNTQAQGALLKLYPAMEESVMKSLETPVDEISNFCPGLDISGILHEYLPTRLYMS